MTFALECCPVCGEHRHDQVYETWDRHYGIPGLYKLVRCAGCSLIFLDPMLSTQELSGLYPTDYYSYRENPRQDRWKKRIKRALGFGTALEPRLRTGGRVLDLGCGSGSFLSQMRDQGWETYGVEVNERAAELGRTKAGLDIFSGTLQEAKFPTEFFDCVRSNHSFEHISCPGETLDEIHRILRVDGRVLLGVPNIGGFNAKLFRQYWWYLGAPVHPFSYSTWTLPRLLERHRFSVEKVAFNSDFSGILGSTQIWLNRSNGRKSSDGWPINNPILKLGCQWASKLMDALGCGDAIEITAAKIDATPI